MRQFRSSGCVLRLGITALRTMTVKLLAKCDPGYSRIYFYEKYRWLDGFTSNVVRMEAMKYPSRIRSNRLSSTHIALRWPE